MPWSNARPKASSTQRGYGKQHRKLRKQWESIVAQGGVLCWRPDCRRPILPGSRWHLGHSDFGGIYMGPECPPCNLKAAAKKARLLQTIRKGKRVVVDRW